MHFVSHAIDGDDMQAALNTGDESEAGRNVGSHSPAAFVLGQGCGHHPGVVAGSAGHGEVLVSAGTFHAAKIERTGPGAEQGSGGSSGRWWYAEITGEKISGPPGNDAQRDLGPYQCRRRLHGGAVPAEYRNDIHLAGHTILG